MKIISSISFLIITVVLFFVVIDPFYTEVKQLRTDVDVYNKALNNSNELQKTRDSLIAVYKSIKQEDKDRLNHFLPSTISNIELILEIEKIANLHGMPIGDIKFESKNLEDSNSVSDNNTVTVSSSGGNSSYGIFPMEFIIEGKYETFLSFLKDLEHNLRLVDIKSISFSVPTQLSSAQADDLNIYKYTIKVDTYWLK